MKAWLFAPAIVSSWLAAYGCSGHPTPSQDAMNGGSGSAHASRTGSPHAPADPAADGDGRRHAWSVDPSEDLPAQPQLSAPQVLGTLIGTRKRAEPEGVEFFGTDMGLTV